MRACYLLACCVTLLADHPALARDIQPSQKQQNAKQDSSKQTAGEKTLSPEEELRLTINAAGNDRAALVRNLEAFLKKYPVSPQRPQIYRALVEAELQLRETGKAANYAERIVALTPEDMSMTVLAIQLLERDGDEAGLHRAVNYATRVMEFVGRDSAEEKSPKISPEEWQAGKNRDRATMLAVRGRLNMKLHDYAAAQKDFEESYSVAPGATSAEKLGEIAELNKNLPLATTEYARAFAFGESNGGSSSRREVRQKLGNVWRLAHGSEEGLGPFILQTYDEVTLSSTAAKSHKNTGVKDPYDFILRKAPEGTPYPLANVRGKILVLSFWATWCGPCRAMEPHFARVALELENNHDVLFLAANCDEDESLVAPYLAEDKPHTSVAFADGLESLFAVNAFPTIIILDRAGKIAYRAEGFDPDLAEKNLSEAIHSALASPATHP